MFFFFKQKTAYEMRISDWSSDVCSSDLLGEALSEALPDGSRPAPPAVNLLTHDSNPRFEPDFEIVRKWRAPVVITSVGKPEIVIDAVHGYGGLVFAGVVSLHHARRAARRGVDGMVLLCAGARSDERRVGNECVRTCR